MFAYGRCVGSVPINCKCSYTYQQYCCACIPLDGSGKLDIILILDAALWQRSYDFRNQRWSSCGTTETCTYHMLDGIENLLHYGAAASFGTIQPNFESRVCLALLLSCDGCVATKLSVVDVVDNDHHDDDDRDQQHHQLRPKAAAGWWKRSRILLCRWFYFSRSLAVLVSCRTDNCNSEYGMLTSGDSDGYGCWWCTMHTNAQKCGQQFCTRADIRLAGIFVNVINCEKYHDSEARCDIRERML